MKHANSRKDRGVGVAILVIVVAVTLGASWAIHSSSKKDASCHHHVCSEGGLCRSFCVQMKGAAPPETPLVLKPSMLPIKRKHHVITMFARRECCADDYVCTWGGLRPPNPPAVLKPSMSAITRKHHVITMFAMRDSCAKHFLPKGCCASPSPRCFNMSSPGLQ